MAEASFAKQFLAQLDSRPSKYPEDHVFDVSRIPKGALVQFPPPEVPYPASPEAQASSPPSSTVSITLKPMKGPTATIEDIDPTKTSVYDLKVAAGKQTGYAPDKIKVLYARKPVPDSKLLAEVLGADAASVKEVELGVMYVGAPTASAGSAPQAAAANDVPVAQGISGQEVLETGGFWEDLEGYLLQRVRDEETAKTASALFRKAWEAR